MFSFEDYREIIRIIQATGRHANYADALSKDSFVIMRHDVEYSVERAYELARVEQSMDFVSTYFFQWTNNSYNILSRRNMDMIKDMHERGQHIGLHFALNGMTDMTEIRKQVRKEMNIHRPSKDVLRENIKLEGLLNAYQDDFFTFADKITPETPVDVKYMSDANHIWRYGYPDAENINGHAKVQILTHPFAWCKEGYNNFNNYRALVQEKYVELIDSIDQECKDFGEYKDYFVEKYQR